MGADIVSEAGLAEVRPRSQPVAAGSLSGVLPKLGFAVYLLALMLPIYWLVNMSSAQQRGHHLPAGVLAASSVAGEILFHP